MSEWIDLKLRKPTAEDADGKGQVLWLYEDGDSSVLGWDFIDMAYKVAWMPIPEFMPLPEPPEGYELVTDKSVPPHTKAMYWLQEREHGGKWVFRSYPSDPYLVELTYCVPKVPPEPQWRPFANAAEFKPHRNRWWKWKCDISSRFLTDKYDNTGTFEGSWRVMFDKAEFDDGTPFGIQVDHPA